ncbi:MAG: GIY-YIG nuclease family protein [Candidatus Altiarchaeia archaeon]
MKGAYVLLIRLDADREIGIGKLGRMRFRRGYYAYVGSALNGIEPRILRHLRSKKKMHWHIDYFLRRGKIVEIHCFSSGRREECRIAERIQERFSSVAGFGCSDCKCLGHLFYSPRLPDLRPG